MMGRRKLPRARAARRVLPVACCVVCEIRQCRGGDRITARLADAALQRLEVDKRGLDGLDRRYLTVVAEKFIGGPVGIETLPPLWASRAMRWKILSSRSSFNWALSIAPARARSNAAAFEHLGLDVPKTARQAAADLFEVKLSVLIFWRKGLNKYWTNLPYCLD